MQTTPSLLMRVFVVLTGSLLRLSAVSSETGRARQTHRTLPTMADEEIRGRRVTLVPLRATDAGELVGLLDAPIARGFLGVPRLARLRRVFAGWERRRSPGAGRAG